MIDSVEQAYQVLAQGCIYEAGTMSWDSILLEAEIGESMTTRTFWLKSADTRLQGNGEIPREYKPLMRRAQLFLREDLLKTTGDRIWGFTFTLHKSGQFSIEYDYNMPDAYTD